ncbi:MAG: hypothetical protein ACRCUP_06600 [Mycoplasmatales bacterium]
MNQIIITGNPDIEQLLCETISEITNGTITELSNIDVFELVPNENKFDNNELNAYIEHFGYQSSQSGHLVGIIRNGHLLSVSQQNKLLKTIESANGQKHHLQIVTSASNLLETLKSRYMQRTIKTLMDTTQTDYFVRTKEQQVFLMASPQVKTEILKFQSFIKAQKYEQGLLQLGTELKVDKVIAEILLTILEKELFEQKLYPEYHKLIEHLERFNFIVNYETQLECILIELKNIKQKND